MSKATGFTQHEEDGMRISVQMYSATALHVVRRILLDGLERSTPDHPDRGVRGSNLWSMFRDYNALVVTVHVGCWHAHDCCGCLCGRRHYVSVIGGLVVVVTKERYNV